MVVFPVLSEDAIADLYEVIAVQAAEIAAKARAARTTDERMAVIAARIDLGTELRSTLPEFAI